MLLVGAPSLDERYEGIKDDLSDSPVTRLGKMDTIVRVLLPEVTLHVYKSREEVGKDQILLRGVYADQFV